MEGLNNGDTAWMAMSCALVLFMTPGLAFFYGGLVRDSNIVNTMMMSIISMGLTTITWLVFGFTWSFDEWGAGKGFTYVGFRNLDAVWSGTTMPGMTFAVFQMTLGLNLESFSRSMVWLHVLCRSDNVVRYEVNIISKLDVRTFAIIAAAIISGAVVERSSASASRLTLSSSWPGSLQCTCPSATGSGAAAGLPRWAPRTASLPNRIEFSIIFP